MPTTKHLLMEELEYRLNSALNYPVSNEELGNFVPYNSTDEGCRELETIIKLVSKSFDQAILKAREEERKEIKSKIGFLRQWLNEDRIDDHKKMVTNEQIEEWLFNFEPTRGKNE